MPNPENESLPVGSHAADPERRRLVLSPQAASAFAKALSRRAQVNHRLRTALGRPQKFRWID